MQFNSIHFVIFFFVTILLGNILKNKTQKIFLLLASIYFYTISNTYFLSLLVLSTLIDYYASIWIDREGQSEKSRKVLLFISIVFNLLILGYFKYAYLISDILGKIFNSEFRTLNLVAYSLNFINLKLGGFSFFTGLQNLLSINRQPLDIFAEKIILPVGISFYTFQSMSYTIDVYRKQIKARTSFIDFSFYVAFFPQLVAGPIVRATTFFRDLDTRLKVDNEDIQIAITRILIGFMRKLVFADNIGAMINPVFANYQNYNAIEIWAAALGFCWQIYFDFAGYTDIAIGIARLFGFKFDPNFNFPMTMSNVTDHWTKWHISFSTWIRDYIYIPLGGSRGSSFIIYRNIFITWLFGGVWHGAEYHFICWGIWQACLLSLHRLYVGTKIRKFFVDFDSTVYKFFSFLFTTFCMGFGFVMFRAETIEKIKGMCYAMLFLSNHGQPFFRFNNSNLGLVLIICYIASYIFSKRNIEVMSTQENKLMYANIVSIFLILFFATETSAFMYFIF
jgi:alginate O-acetyltransferase complex protein AlgI